MSKHDELRARIRMTVGLEESLAVDDLAREFGMLVNVPGRRPTRVYLAVLLVLAALNDAGNEVPGVLSLPVVP